jgi:hypothetical protein
MKERLFKILTSVTTFALLASTALAIECTKEGNLPPDLDSILTSIRNALAAIGIIIAAIYIILGGYTFITSSGSAEKIETAKRQILYAAIGVVIIVIAVALVDIVKKIVCG